jgi:hypothetical protein
MGRRVSVGVESERRRDLTCNLGGGGDTSIYKIVGVGLGRVVREVR